MPQLSPLFWDLSVFMGFLFLCMIVEVSVGSGSLKGESGGVGGYNNLKW